MSGLEIFSVILTIYIAVLLIGAAFACADVNGLNQYGWVKIIFWPITVAIFLLGCILWLSIWAPIQLFKGLILCFDEIGDFFITVYCNAIGRNEKENK